MFKMNEPKDYEYLLLCDGSTISEENYPELVAVLGGTQLPNLIDRFLQGAATAGTYKEAGLPNIEGSFFPRTFLDYASRFSKGAFWGQTSTRSQSSNNGTNEASDKIYFNASRSNSIYGSSTTVQPPAYTAKIYICYAG